MSDGYLINGLTARRDRLLKEHRLLMSRYATLERTHHPSKLAQGKLIDLNRAIIDLVDQALLEAKR